MKKGERRDDYEAVDTYRLELGSYIALRWATQLSSKRKDWVNQRIKEAHLTVQRRLVDRQNQIFKARKLKK